MSATHEDQLTDIENPVGPFTGFGNFFRKELQDWWKSWRFLIIIIVMSVIMLAIALFVLPNVLEHERHPRQGEPAPSKELMATRLLVILLNEDGPGLILYIVIIILSTMGLLTVEKSTGTLAWNLTKPLGRTGLLLSKWFAATLMLWIGMCIIPLLLASVAMGVIHGVFPEMAKVVPVIAAASAWIGLWVLLSLTISLGFHSQAAVAGIMFAVWIVPNVLGGLVGLALDDKEAMKWILDRLGTNSPYWAWDMFADKTLSFRREVPESKSVWIWAFSAWFVGLWAFTLRVFNRQEIGS